MIFSDCHEKIISKKRLFLRFCQWYYLKLQKSSFSHWSHRKIQKSTICHWFSPKFHFTPGLNLILPRVNIHPGCRSMHYNTTGCPTLKCIFWDGFCDNTIRLTDLQWWFLYSWGKIFWYSCPTFAKKINGMVKIFVWKKKKFYIKKFFLKFFEKFFCLKSLFGLIYSEKIFFEKFQKNFWPEKILNFFFQMKNFTILSIFFAKVRQEYQNIFPQLYKNLHCRSVSLIVLSQKPSQNKHFNVGHPV